MKNKLTTIALMGALALSPATAEEQSKTSVSNTYMTEAVQAAGFITGGPAIYNSISTDLGNGFGAFTWGNLDLETTKFDEVDVGVSYTKKVTDSLSATGTLQHWFYPSGKLGEKGDSVGTVALNYAGDFDARIMGLQRFTGEGGQFVHGSISKSFELGENTTVTPSLNAAWTHKYFNTETGMSHITPKVSITHTVTDDLSVGVFGAYQFGFNGKESTPYAGFSASWKF